VTAHAEMLVISSALSNYQLKNLEQCTLYVTLEPCPMCASALYWAKLGRLVYAAPDPKRGFTIYSPSLLHPQTTVISNILLYEASSILKDFFLKLRKKELK
ncbi:MAG: nucleoside deaminase, partial [Bacteroidales bacterium]|nr:nucleoside deaminase [Bacteroidales bacterium]